MAATVAIKDYPFKIKYTNNYTYDSATTGSSSSELVFNGTRQHKLNLHMSPYARYRVQEGMTSDIVRTMTSQYASSSGLSIYSSGTDEITVTDTGGGIQNVVFRNNRYTLDANSYITGYTVDSNTGNLTVDMETVDYTINGTGSNIFSDYVFEQTGTATGWGGNYYSQESFADNKRWRLKQNLLVRRGFRGDTLGQLKDNERVALETLREMVTEREFRKYLKYGFVLVPGESGAVYQVFRNRSHTKVWKGGKLIEEVCVRIKSSENVPPTDNVIALATMIRADEDEFKKCGNVYKMAKAA